MEAAIAFIAGAVAKIYDDGVDNNLITNEYHKKMLETLHCFLAAAISINNFTFSAFCVFVNCIVYFADKSQYKGEYEFSLLLMHPVFLLLSFHTRAYLTTNDILTIITYISWSATESKLFKEESSPKKTISRLIGIVLHVLILLYVPLSSGIYNGLIYIVGYLLISTTFQFYACSHMTIRNFIIDGMNGMFNTLFIDLPVIYNIIPASKLESLRI